VVDERNDTAADRIAFVAVGRDGTRC
jgi:hypothetical protein